MSWLIDIMKQGMDFFYQLTGNYGISIILLTLIIKMITLPLTFSQTKQMKKMQELQPQIKAIQEKHKNNPEKANKETLALWKENKVNPASGCLPLILQLPFFIAFFNVLNNYAYVGATAFLWIQDITSPDPYYIMPLLAAGSTYLQMKFTTASGDSTQKNMALMMPMVIGVMSLRFAAGLTIYWVSNNLFTMVQQILTPKPAAPVAKGESK